METLNGMAVYIREPAPKMTLSEKVPVTDEFRASVNAWMLDFFGHEQDYIYCLPNANAVYMSSKSLAVLKRVAKCT
ncbi:hypothetical protein UFOVP814_5 [uncultured Caudovirales phage]|uniref:Uncharacterized protein n=1 Tax=uncultured Caudovirales phage TaxID=2100421 RepID=A0A6J5P6L8_9CAUD|nr:hypothetical protein UFOVP814_5 [uncultured Caudovirales phage]